MTGLLLKNRSSFLYGRKPASSVPVYALINNCQVQEDTASSNVVRETRRRSRRNGDYLTADFGSKNILTNDVPGKAWKNEAMPAGEVGFRGNGR